MKAAVCRAFGKPLDVEDINIAEPALGEVRVRLKACAICHSDITFMDGGWGGDLPAVYGHEAAGIVETVGSDVSNVETGDHVVVTLIRSCGSCYYCNRADEVFCEAIFPLDQDSPISDSEGVTLVHGLRTGGFAEEVVVDASQVCAIPKDIPFDSASLLACGVITGFGAVSNTVTVPPKSNVVVIGCGGIGLNTIQGAVHAGAATIIACDVVASKLVAAEKFGATHVVNASETDPVSAVRTLTAGRGANYVFVTVGAKNAIDQCPALLAKGGTAVIVGIPATGVMSEYDPGTFASLGQSIVGSKMGSARVSVDIPEMITLYQAGQLMLDELISGRYALQDINQAIDSVKRGDALRNVIVFP